MGTCYVVRGYSLANTAFPSEFDATSENRQFKSVFKRNQHFEQSQCLCNEKAPLFIVLRYQAKMVILSLFLMTIALQAKWRLV